MTFHFGIKDRKFYINDPGESFSKIHPILGEPWGNSTPKPERERQWGHFIGSSMTSGQGLLGPLWITAVKLFKIDHLFKIMNLKFQRFLVTPFVLSFLTIL